MYRKNNDIGFMLRILNGALERRFNHELQKDDLTVSQMHVLGYLHRHGGETVTQKDIEDYLEVSHPTTVGIIKRLCAKGLIATEMHKEGRLEKIVRPTEKAEKLNRKIMNGHIAAEKKMTRGFSEEELIQLKDYMKRLAENMKDDMPGTFCGRPLF